MRRVKPSADARKQGCELTHQPRMATQQTAGAGTYAAADDASRTRRMKLSADAREQAARAQAPASDDHAADSDQTGAHASADGAFEDETNEAMHRHLCKSRQPRMAPPRTASAGARCCRWRLEDETNEAKARARPRASVSSKCHGLAVPAGSERLRARLSGASRVSLLSVRLMYRQMC